MYPRTFFKQKYRSWCQLEKDGKNAYAQGLARAREGGGRGLGCSRNWLVHDAPCTRIQIFLKHQNVLHETTFCQHETSESAHWSVNKNRQFQNYPSSCGWVLRPWRQVLGPFQLEEQAVLWWEGAIVGCAPDRQTCEEIDYEQSLFFLGPSSRRPRHANDHARDWRRKTGEVRKKRVSLSPSRAAALVSRVSRLRRSTLTRACTSLTKSEEQERLLAV